MPEKENQQYHYIYKTTCTVTGKYYYGMHSTYDLNDGYMGSGKYLGYSINKHGKENHVCEILEHYFTREWLREREAELVCAETLTDPLCMNLKLGGEGGWELVNADPLKSARQRQVIKKSHATRKARLADSLALRTKDRLLRSENMKKRHIAGKVKYDTFTGRTHSVETIQKMRDLKVGYGNGKSNSQYGTCWVYSLVDKICKKVNKAEVESYQNAGWIVGRKMKF